MGEDLKNIYSGLKILIDYGGTLTDMYDYMVFVDTPEPVKEQDNKKLRENGWLRLSGYSKKDKGETWRWG